MEKVKDEKSKVSNQGEHAMKDTDVTENPGAEIEGRTDDDHDDEEMEEGNHGGNDFEKGAGENGAIMRSDEREARIEDPESKQAEASYSTRGRSNEVPVETHEINTRDTQIELPKEKEHTPTIGPSFLSDSLTDEERRTRTRYLPDVDGMNMLRKQEIKGDLALARAVLSAAPQKVKRSREDDMDVDETAVPSDDDRGSENRPGTVRVALRNLDYVLPSTAFTQPPGATSNGDSSEKSKPAPPTEVDFETAFNPPRPPESIGPKKKHRMLRWERRPADIEVDLNTYRKTVQKTREELRNANSELDRIQSVDNHLRMNFFAHLECLNEEHARLNAEIAEVQQDCIGAADLLTSRTRSRGAGKSSHVMRDVLTVLRSRGAELKEKGLSLETEGEVERKKLCLGGVGFQNFKDRTVVRSDEEDEKQWVVPGDNVMTPYGRGTVVQVLHASGMDQNGSANHKQSNLPDADQMDVENVSKKDQEFAQSRKSFLETIGEFVAPRVEVKLPFGVGIFNIDSLTILEDPASYTDAQLAQRWRGMIETADNFGEVLDLDFMASREHGTEHSEGTSERPNGDKGGLVAFGSDLLPSQHGRGLLLSETEVSQLDELLYEPLFNGINLLGSKDNPGVPPAVRMREDREQERILLQAKQRQLKNEVNRQRRIRALNQRTYAACEERAFRVESLVSEMRTDLKNLKRRLDEEVSALGIDNAEVERIMASHYVEMDEGNDMSPYKRSRTSAVMDIDTEDEDGDDRHHEHNEELATGAISHETD